MFIICNIIMIIKIEPWALLDGAGWNGMLDKTPRIRSREKEEKVLKGGTQSYMTPKGGREMA